MGDSVHGVVVRGTGEGRTVGYPTANLALTGEAFRPDSGVYACWVHYAGQRYPAALVSGVHYEEGLPRVEVHLIGFSGDLYGHELDVQGLRRIRGVEQFSDLVALRQRIEQDIVAIRRVLGV